MKNLRTTALCLCITLYSLCAVAQNQMLRTTNPDIIKPKLFQNLPEKISINPENLNDLLNTPIGHEVIINLSIDSKFQFEGQVVSASAEKESNIQTVVIRSTNYNGARLTLSKITNTDGTISYSGRILSFQHDDLLELKNQDGHYVLIKRKFNDLINE
jgi:hypothetical protein